MKKVFAIIAIALLFILTITFVSCIISNPKPDECDIIEATIIEIAEGTSYDIVFRDKGGDRYYINRGLEQGLNLEDLNAAVLNKTVTLHLPRVLGGTVTTEHIAQLAVGDEVIFTEFD